MILQSQLTVSCTTVWPMHRQLVVSGFHRSGTSMTMQALVSAGLHAGNSLIGGDPSNPDGHFEDIETVNLHDNWLRSLGSDWCHTDELPQIDATQASTGIATIRDRLDEAQKPWGVKDPRACLFLQHWFSTLQRPAGVFVYRHFAGCLHSLQRRQANELLVNPDTSANAHRFWSHPEVALESWLVHNNAIIAIAQQFPEQCVVISQEAVIHGAPIISAVNDSLSIALDTQCDIGVDASKTAQRKEFCVSSSGLQSQLEHTWEQLQQLAVLPTDHTPKVQWVEPQRADNRIHIPPPSLTSQWDRLGISRSQGAQE